MSYFACLLISGPEVSVCELHKAVASEYRLAADRVEAPPLKMFVPAKCALSWSANSSIDKVANFP